MKVVIKVSFLFIFFFFQSKLEKSFRNSRTSRSSILIAQKSIINNERACVETLKEGRRKNGSILSKAF